VTDDPYRYFRIEARELVDQLDSGVLELERAPDADLIGRLLRVAHTLKGAARVVKLPEIAQECHALEEVLAPHRQGPALPEDQVRYLLAVTDRLRAHVAALSEPATPAPADGTTGTTSTAGALDLTTDRTAWASADEIDELLSATTEAAAELSRVRRGIAAVAELGAMVDQLPRTTDVQSADRAAPRVDDVRAAVGTARGLLGEAVDRAEQELRRARELAEQLRLTPVGTIFNLLDRAVRDAAQTLPDKRVIFSGRGGDQRLGPHVLREVHNALLHVVRNAVVHGIETQVERLAAGKPSTGTIVVEVTRQGRRLRFACRDDGAGFDLTAVREALRRQRPDLPDPASLGARELFELLQRGGASTSGTVTAVAGRGIGLDVLRAAAQRLGGEVSIDSRPGAGAAVELVVPVSLLVLEGLAVRVDGRSVMIPLDSVRRAAWVQRDDVVDTPDGEAVMHEGEAVRFAPLGLLLSGVPSETTGRFPCRTVLVRGAGGTVAVVVDQLIGPAGIISRPLPALAPAYPIVAGAALDADGSPVLVLDPDGLVAQVQRTSIPTTAAKAEDAPVPPVLVVDDSLTTRMLEQGILEAAGYDVDVAASGEEALEKAHRRAYGLMLVDVEMPGIDGFTVIERMRADAALHDLPAILVTSRASPQDLRRGAEAGANGYVIKGEFDQTVLLQRIRTLMRQR
jgi:two-component system chemotaxis sensor kinase CheA